MQIFRKDNENAQNTDEYARLFVGGLKFAGYQSPQSRSVDARIQCQGGIESLDGFAHSRILKGLECFGEQTVGFLPLKSFFLGMAVIERAREALHFVVDVDVAYVDRTQQTYSFERCAAAERYIHLTA